MNRIFEILVISNYLVYLLNFLFCLGCEEGPDSSLLLEETVTLLSFCFISFLRPTVSEPSIFKISLSIRVPFCFENNWYEDGVCRGRKVIRVTEFIDPSFIELHC